MTSNSIPTGTVLNFRVDRKIVTSGDAGEWGTPGEIMASLEPFEDEPQLRNSHVRLSDDQKSVWITLPPKLLAEEGPDSRVVDVVVTGKFKLPNDDRSVVTQILRFVRNQQAKDTFLHHTNLALRINIPDIDEADGIVRALEDGDIDEADGIVRALEDGDIDAADGIVRALEDGDIDEADGIVRALEDGDETESDNDESNRTWASERKRKAEDSDEDMKGDDDTDDEGDTDLDDVEDITEWVAERNAKRIAERNAEREQRSAEPTVNKRPRRGQRRMEDLPLALEDRVYVAPSTIKGAGRGLFAAVDFDDGDTVAWMGFPVLVDRAAQKSAEAQGFPHDSFIHNDKMSGTLRRDRGKLVMDRDFNDVNQRPLWYFINYGEKEANLKVEYNPKEHTFKWIAKRFIPRKEELFFNYTPGEKVTFNN
jgi:hypothetical protein